MRVGDIALYGRQGWADYVAGVFDVPVDVLLTGVERVVRKANLHSRPAYTMAGLAPMHPKDWADIQKVYPFVASPQERQPWLWTYPPLVVDQEKLASQIAWCLDPNKAMADWFYSEIGRKTGLLYPGLGVTRQLQAIARRDEQVFLDLLGP